MSLNAYEDEDGIDGPFDAAMEKAMREDELLRRRRSRPNPCATEGEPVRAPCANPDRCIHARLRAEAREEGRAADVAAQLPRLKLVAHIREQIAAGTYVTDGKVDIAAKNLLRALERGDE